MTSSRARQSHYQFWRLDHNGKITCGWLDHDDLGSRGSTVRFQRFVGGKGKRFFQLDAGFRTVVQAAKFIV